jgi:hypothetical protein
MNDASAERLTETHHALLFAWISRAIIQRVGWERGEAAIRKATRRYGEQRGRRMALRARANGRELSMTNFLVFGEWRGSEQSGAESEKSAVGADVLSCVRICPWNTAWVDEELLPYGRLYCREIDHALVRGYNPELELDVRQTLSNDGEPCEFIFHQADLEEAGRISADLGDRAVMSWAYHCGHLYATFSQALIEDFGQVGEDAVEGAMLEFATRFGERTTRLVRSYQDVDFDNLPG